MDIHHVVFSPLAIHIWAVPSSCALMPSPVSPSTAMGSLHQGVAIRPAAAQFDFGKALWKICTVVMMNVVARPRVVGRCWAQRLTLYRRTLPPPLPLCWPMAWGGACVKGVACKTVRHPYASSHGRPGGQMKLL